MAGFGTPAGLQCGREFLMHAANVLALLNATRCERCGRAAVPGVTMCQACALQPGRAACEGDLNDPWEPANAAPSVSPSVGTPPGANAAF